MLCLPKDRKETELIERRRRIEEERKPRIFNARQRKIGIDKESIERQIIEKHKLLEEQQRIDEAYEKQRINEDRICVLLEKQVEEEKRRKLVELNEFRNVYQRPEGRREFDLNDPEILKKMLPARINDDDPRLGISSAQKFVGEDVPGQSRRFVQREQIRCWLEQQIEERQIAESQRLKAEQEYSAALAARDQRACELERLEQSCRHRMQEAIFHYNQALAEEQAHRKHLESIRESEDNQAEIYNNVTGDLLTENPDVAKSNLGLDRCIGFMYKGMNAEELAEYYNEQKRQIEEKKKQREEEKRIEKEWEKLAIGFDEHIVLTEYEEKKKQREIAKEIMEENRKLAEEQRARKCYYEKIVYKNSPTSAFYDQFNTSTR